MNKYTNWYCGLITATFCQATRFTAKVQLTDISLLFGEFLAVFVISALLFKLVLPRVERSQNSKKAVIILVVLLIAIPLFIYSSSGALT